MRINSDERGIASMSVSKRNLLVGLLSILISILMVAPLVECRAQNREQLQKPQIQQKVERAPDRTIQVVPEYSTIYYKSGELKIEAYFYKPEGEGRFPLVIYNHGSRAGGEKKEIPFRYVANVLKANGYAELVPERRGYGKSDGQTFTDEVGNDISDLMMKRFREEASDVLAGVDFIKTNHSIDPTRIAIMGWSHGGVVTLLTASERHEFVAVIDQAGGALTWNRSPTLQTELPAAARKINAPTVCMDAENDATTNAVKEVGEAIKSSGQSEKTIIYPAFTPSSNPSHIAPGHLIFGAEGISIWQGDMLSFLHAHLAVNASVDQNRLDARLRLRD